MWPDIFTDFNMSYCNESFIFNVANWNTTSDKNEIWSNTHIFLLLIKADFVLYVFPYHCAWKGWNVFSFNNRIS